MNWLQIIGAIALVLTTATFTGCIIAALTENPTKEKDDESR